MRAFLAVSSAVFAGVFGQAVLAQAPPGNADPTVGVHNTMAQRMQACVGCHGPQGRATNVGYLPRIAGKPAGYLYNQLQNFRTGRRHNAAMTHLLQHLSDDYLREIAQYFSELDLPYPPARPEGLTPERRRIAQALVVQGDPERELPSCISCHGEQMAGRLPAVPGLMSLPPDYLMAQFGAWRTGLRKAHAPDCMGAVAHKLTPDEITAVSQWLSAQTLPLGVKPAPASTQPLPMACGSAE